ncbi:MAG: PhzF family phenazine biosynthesis protein [Marmoricola sp.]
MDIPLIQIDAFADGPFTGNPAAVMPLQDRLDDALLQQIAEENNLSETAFLLRRAAPDGAPEGAPDSPGEPAYDLRWFTPALEVALCGHATLASAAYLLDDVHPEADRIHFHTLSGRLTVERAGERRLAMDFPADHLEPVTVDEQVASALGCPVLEMYQAMDLVCVVPEPAMVAALTPDHTALVRLPQRGVVVTAATAGHRDWPGTDFVSRWFGAGAGVGEDPVTGSAHTQLMPYWAPRLGRDRLRARQLSARGGEIDCELRGDRVRLVGGYRRYLEGVAHVEG